MKSDPVDRLLLTAWLSPAERRDALREGSVVDEEILRAVERLARLVDESRIPASANDDALERLAARRAGLSATGRREFDDEVAAALRSMPEGDGQAERWKVLCERMGQLDRSSPAVDHFSRLTGRSLRKPDHAAEPSRVVRFWTANRWAAAAVLATLALTATLGRVLEDPMARAAFRSLETRSDVRTRAGLDSADRVAGWTARLEAARNLRLGLWPVYDREALERVESELVAARDSTPAMMLLLGETRLMRGAVDTGLEAVRHAADAGSDEARALLLEIR